MSPEIRTRGDRYAQDQNRFKIDVGHPLDEATLKHELANRGAAASPGDRVQITKIDFRPKEILLEINGGPKGHFRLKDHLQVGMGGVPTPVATSGPPSANTNGMGALLVLDYARPSRRWARMN